MKMNVKKSAIAIFAALMVASSISTSVFAAAGSTSIVAIEQQSRASSHTIMAGAASNGSISPAGTVSAINGENKTFTIKPNSGYEVNEVIVDGSRKGALSSYTFNNVTFNHSIVASFKKAGSSSYKTNLLKTDTRSYKMAPGNVYGAKIEIDGSQFNQSDVKVYSSRNHIASVTKITDNIYQIKGLAPGTTYIMAEIGNTHASIRVDVQNGVKQGGEACRSVSIVEASSTSSKPSTPSGSATVSQQNALKKAKDYLNVMPFSYDGLVKQLEHDQFSHTDAIYAVENCGANWNQQALEKAKDYLNVMPFSYEGLVKQLEHDQFSNSQATYAVKNCGANWNQQAAEKAKDYLGIMAFSRDGLIRQLEHDGFTNTQAVYGVNSVGL